jgi:rhodanese-related sulfurtransferase
MNIKGYESLDTVLEKAKQPLSPKEFEAVATETQALVLDTRDASDFAKVHVPNSINIGLNGSFAMWVGEMIIDVKQEILLITDEGKEEESMVRLSRIGFDNTIGYLKGGVDAWVADGFETNSVDRISSADLAEMNLEDVKVFDIRKKSEFDSEHMVGAINVPLNEINNHLEKFPKEERFIIHCAGGYRSMIASSILKQRGWDNFADVKEGFSGIKDSGLEVTEYVCPTTLL